MGYLTLRIPGDKDAEGQHFQSVEDLAGSESLGAPDLVLKPGQGKPLFRNDLLIEIRHIQRISWHFKIFFQNPSHLVELPMDDVPWLQGETPGPSEANGSCHHGQALTWSLDDWLPPERCR